MLRFPSNLSQQRWYQPHWATLNQPRYSWLDTFVSDDFSLHLASVVVFILLFFVLLQKAAKHWRDPCGHGIICVCVCGSSCVCHSLACKRCISWMGMWLAFKVAVLIVTWWDWWHLMSVWSLSFLMRLKVMWGLVDVTVWNLKDMEFQEDWGAWTLKLVYVAICFSCKLARDHQAFWLSCFCPFKSSFSSHPSSVSYVWLSSYACWRNPSVARQRRETRSWWIPNILQIWRPLLKSE